MSTAERDPRTDPRPGDVLKPGSNYRYEVTATKRGVTCKVTHHEWIPAKDWEARMRNARVVARGAERDTP